MTLLTALALGWLDLRYQWRPALVMVLLLMITSMAYLTLQGYQSSLQAEFPPLENSFLVVQESHTVGEISGSRLDSTIGDQLSALGLSPVIPEIHAVVGTSTEDASMLRGVDPALYRQANSFTLLSGQPLAPANQDGSPSRQAFIGWRLAERRGVAAGEVLRLRGRDFQVSGIFRTGTYVDNEAWVSLPDARELLGWGEDVSIFLVPVNGPLQPDTEFAPGVGVARRGEDFQADVRRYFPVLELISATLQLTGAATALALGSLLVRLAWVQRRYLAILRSLGYPRASLFAYLAGQALAISLSGALLGLSGSLILTSTLRTNVLSLALRPVYNWQTLAASLAWVLGVALISALAPAVWLSRLNLVFLLRRE